MRKHDVHAFELQESRQTLAEGISECFSAHPSLLRGEQLSCDARAFFRSHDAAHVVFGCGLSLQHEAVVKISSLFGTTGAWSVLRGYRLHESIEIYKRLDHREIIDTALTSFVVVPRTILRCPRQRKRWPWSAFASYMETPLSDLRDEFGIRVAG
jgi:hypothetical protein